MKKIFFASLGLLINGLVLHAQSLLVVEDTLDFGTTNELTPSIRTLRIYNTGFGPRDVIDIDFFNIYEDPPFSLTDTAFTVMPGDTHMVQVQFLPEHNIWHQMALVIKTTSGFGHLAVALQGQGTYSKAYYSSTENRSEQSLKTALKARISQGYNSLGYSPARDNMFMIIDNKKVNGQGATVNTLECVYTGTVITGYANRSAAQNGSPQFNTEHTFPQGMFNSNEPMRSDLFHLYPTTNTSNSRRGNDPFGMVTNPGWSEGGSKSGGGKFEPRDAQKGRAARSMMYFVLRYQDYNNFFQGQEAILRSWHEQFPPDTVERRRNADIESVQNNRNPFIDYPQFAERITSLVSNTAPPAIRNLYTTDDTIRLGQGQGWYVYTYVMYNDGSDTIAVSNLSLSDNRLSFYQGNPGSFSLSPQSYKLLRVAFNSGYTYNATLDYTVNLANQSNLSVPIVTGPSIGLEEEKVADMVIFPNPVRDYLHLSISSEEIREVWLYGLSGKRKRVYLNSGNKLSLREEPAGLYLITVITKAGKAHHAKVLIK